MKIMRHGVVLALALLLMLDSALRAQVLQQVPGDALVVLKVNNLKGTSDKIATLAKDLGVAAFAPPLADPLGALQVQTKMQQGVNVGGDFAFVFLDPSKTGGPDKSMLLLVPVLDYKIFLSNWPDAQTTGAVSSVRFGTNNEPAFVANWGNYAAISPSEQAVANKPTAGMTAPSVTTKEMAAKDAVLYVNLNNVRPLVLPQLQQNRGMITNQIDMAFAGNPQVGKLAPLIKAIVNQLINGGEEFLKDGEAASVGLAITPQGINATFMTEFTKDSYIAQNFASIKNSDAPMLSGLPTGKYLFYGGGVVDDPQRNAKNLSDMVDPVLKELLAMGPEMAPATEYMNALKTFVASGKSTSFGVLAPSGQIGTQSLIQFVQVQTGQAQAMQDAYTKMMNAQAALMKALAIPGTASTQVIVTPKAKTLDGVSFDQVVNKIDANPQDPVAMQQKQIMDIMYGPGGVVMNYGVVTPDKLVLSMGVSDAVLSSTVAAAKSNAAPLADNPNLKAVAAQLPKQRLMSGYLNLGELVTTALNYSKQFGFAVPVQLPPDLPPIGMTIGTEENTAIRADVNVPTALIQSLVAGGMQAMMQMQGGGPGAAPGGL
jgi:hypothetical protein